MGPPPVPSARGKRMLIRADADSSIGAGHVMRCLALAQAWKDGGGSVRFVMSASPGIESIQALLRSEGIEILPVRAGAPIGSPADAAATAELARDLAADWVVMDGYRFDGTFQRTVRGSGARTVVIDDNGECAPHQADIVINQNVHASADMYRDRWSVTELLLGTRYAMLRRAFRQARPVAGQQPAVAARLLVTLGGADPDNTTLKVLQALPRTEVPALNAVAVVGGLNPHLPALEAVAAESTGAAVAIQLRRNEPDMPAVMAAADLAVAAAGSTVWELLFMGVPIISLVIADNQRRIAEKLAALGALLSLGWHADASPAEIARGIGRLALSQQQRQDMAARGRQLVDGKGVFRIIDALLARRPI